MKLHLFVDFLEMFIFEQGASTWVMALEGGDIEDEIIEYEQCFLIISGVVVDLFEAFEFVIVVGHRFNFLFIIQLIKIKNGLVIKPLLINRKLS